MDAIDVVLRVDEYKVRYMSVHIFLEIHYFLKALYSAISVNAFPYYL